MIDPIDMTLSPDGERWLVNVDYASPNGDHTVLQAALLARDGSIILLPEGVLVVENEERLEKQ